MAITGIILCGFVLGHMIGNLQAFQGREKLNHYAEFLHQHMGMLWGVRAFLLGCLTVHIITAFQLTIRNWKSRPSGYRKRGDLGVDYAARTMVWTGPIVAAFLGYHLAHFTVGSAHPAFNPADVYGNVISGFSVPGVSIFYIIANALLGMHLYHGVWSFFQTLGWEHPRFNFWRRAIATLFALIVAAGNISIPLAVLSGIIGG